MEKLHDGSAFDDRGRFNEDVGTRLIHLTKDLKAANTHTEAVLEEIAGHLPSHSTDAEIITDGGIEDLSLPITKIITDSIDRLCKSHSLKHLFVVGVHQEYRRQWDHWVEPLGEVRGIVKGVTDADFVINQIEEDAE